jgi:serine/threonine protein phosphatase 1
LTNQLLVLSDVHGQADLLEEALLPHYHQGYELVVLGDMFDRATPGGDSRVLALLRAIQDSPDKYGFSKVTLLRGNHEDLLIKAIQSGPQSDDYDIWLYNGGDPDFYKEAVDHLDWLLSLPLYYVKDDYLFVHAGVVPGVPLEDQRPKDLVWIRDPFLTTEDHGLHYYVVHGHTPVKEVDVRDNRMCIDTGSFYSGNLSTVLLPYN